MVPITPVINLRNSGPRWLSVPCTFADGEISSVRLDFGRWAHRRRFVCPTCTLPLLRDFCIYGAGGHTGSSVAAACVRLGLRPILAGRPSPRLRAVARSLQLSHREVALEDQRGLDSLLSSVPFVLNCAGPFSDTAIPLVARCLASGADYLDVNGDPLVMEQVRTLAGIAEAAGIMALPGVGLSVVPATCVAGRLVAETPNATSLAVGLSGAEVTSRGSVASMFEQAGSTLVLRNGLLTRIAPDDASHAFDFGIGPVRGVAIGLADIVALHHQTGIPNVTAFMEATPRLTSFVRLHARAGPIAAGPAWQAGLKAVAGLFPARGLAPPGNAVMVVEAAGPDGQRRAVRMTLGDVHAFTARAAARVAELVLKGERGPGYQTPGALFGAGLLDGIVEKLIEHKV